MSRLTEQELTEILDANKGIPMVNLNKVYPPLQPAENIMPFMRIPEHVTLCEKIGGTEYTVTAHFREDGRDLIGLLSRIFMRDTADYSFDFENNKVLIPSAYKVSKGIGVAKVSDNPYGWEPCMVSAILENVAYIGVTESFKSTRLGFKSKKRIPTAKDRRAYIENAHTPIIDREVWDKVQMIRENKRRPTKSGITSMFSVLLYCADCGVKLSLATANGYTHFRCSQYKRTSRTQNCTQHYIREEVLYRLVLKQLQHFLSYLQQFERVFVKQQIDTTLEERRFELSAKQKQIEKDEKRIKELDHLFRKIYEDNVNGKLNDERFYRLSDGYEAEQEQLKRDRSG